MKNYIIKFVAVLALGTVSVFGQDCIKANQVQILFGASVDANGCLVVVQRPTETLPSGFVEVFGPRPVEGKDYQSFEFARLNWEQNLRLFDGRVQDARLDAAQAAFDYFGAGKALAYKLKSGEKLVRFAADNSVEFPFDIVASYPQIAIAVFQSVQIENGKSVDHLHPFLDKLRAIVHKDN